MSGDISKKTLVILLVVAIVISVVGTWVILDNVSEIKGSLQDVTEQTGIVKVFVKDNNLPPSTATGQVVLTVK